MFLFSLININVFEDKLVSEIMQFDCEITCLHGDKQCIQRTCQTVQTKYKYDKT